MKCEICNEGIFKTYSSEEIENEEGLPRIVEYRECPICFCRMIIFHPVLPKVRW